MASFTLTIKKYPHEMSDIFTSHMRIAGQIMDITLE